MYFDKFFKRNSIFLFSIPLLFCFLFEIIQGIIDKNDASKVVSNLFGICFFVYFLLLYAKKIVDFAKVDICILVFIFIGIVGAWCGAIWDGYGINKDVTAVFRSLFLGWLAFSFSSSFSLERSQLWKIITFLWAVISFSIVLSWIFDLGIYTYIEYKVGHKFYFQSVNELTFVYVILWASNFFLSTSFVKKAFFTLTTVFVFMLIGNKAFIPLLVISFLFILWQNISGKSKVFIAFFVFLFFIVLFVTGWGQVLLSMIINAITYVLINYSQGGGKLAEKLSLVGPFSALISQRDMLWAYSFDLLLKEYNVWEIVFGRSYTGYGITYGVYRDLKFSFAENDVLDIFMSYGVVGIFTLFMIIEKLYKMSVYFWAKNVNKITVFLFVVTGFMTGHVMLFSFPVFIFSFLLGATYDKSKKMD